MLIRAAPEDPGSPFATSVREALSASGESGLPDLPLSRQRETEQTKNQRENLPPGQYCRAFLHSNN